MIRLSRMTDYAVVVLSAFAQTPEKAQSAAQLTTATGLPPATVSKLLKLLARTGFLDSRRGAAGGYHLTRSPDAITMAEVVTAIEGPISLTYCSEAADGNCDLEHLCPMRGRWDKVNRLVRKAFEDVTLAEMAQPPDFFAMGEDEGEPALADDEAGARQ